jgi:hypothetical protein
MALIRVEFQKNIGDLNDLDYSLFHDKSQVLYLPFDRDDGSYARDRSGYNNHGVIYGATRVDGIIGRALSFDGVDDYVGVPNSPSLNPTRITVAMWLYPTSYDDLPSNYREPLRKEGCYHVTLNTSADVWEIGIKDPQDYTHQVVFPQNDIPLNTWTYITLTFDGYTVILYLNAGVHKTLSWTGDIGSSTGNLYIGEYGGLNRWYAGYIDEVRIYNRALSQDEIQRIMYMREIP